MDSFRRKLDKKMRQAVQAAGTLRKVVTHQPLHSEHEFSPAFLTEKARLRRSRAHLDQFAVSLADFVATGHEHAKSYRKMVMTLTELVGDEYATDDDSGQRRAARAISRAHMEIIQMFDHHLTQMELVLDTLMKGLKQEVQEARDTKSQCYEALYEMDLWRSKVTSMGSHSKAVDGSAFADVSQKLKTSSQQFLSLQTEATKRMADFSYHKNISILEALFLGLNLNKIFFRNCESFCESFDFQAVAGVASIDDLRSKYEAARTDRDRAHKQLLSAKIEALNRPISSRFSTAPNEELPGVLPPLHVTEEVHFVAENVENLPLLKSQGPNAMGFLAMTNYRLIFSAADADDVNMSHDELLQQDNVMHDGTMQYYSIPLKSILTVRREKTVSDRKVLTIFCKDTRVYSLSFNDSALDIQALFLTLSEAATQSTLRSFAFSFIWPHTVPSESDGWKLFDAKREFNRLGVGVETSPHGSTWRISTANSTYATCASYPSVFAVPLEVSDSEASNCAMFRTKNRLPILSWFHPVTGVAIYRSSQPKNGLNLNTSQADQAVLRKLGLGGTGRINVFDARPRVNAVANAAVGGGWEDNEGYPNCTVHFLGIENIHVVREAFLRMRGFDESSLDIRAKDWLRLARDVLAGTNRVLSSVLEERVPCLIHCSDGWDRTSQLTSLAMLLLDPYYRTVPGFLILIEKEWLTAGHQFAKRYGHEEKRHKMDSQQSPVFHLWLDCVYQISRQIPGLLEFNEDLLILIIYHVTSCLFGTFLGDNERYRREKRIREKTESLWTVILHFYSQGEFRNTNFVPSVDVSTLYPLNVDMVRPWEVYSKLGQWYIERASDRTTIPSAADLRQQRLSRQSKQLRVAIDRTASVEDGQGDENDRRDGSHTGFTAPTTQDSPGSLLADPRLSDSVDDDDLEEEDTAGSLGFRYPPHDQSDESDAD